MKSYSKHIFLNWIFKTRKFIVAATFRFDDLRIIDVSGCNLITSVGFQALAMQNRRIEILTASSCNGLENEGKLKLVRFYIIDIARYFIYDRNAF